MGDIGERPAMDLEDQRIAPRDVLQEDALDRLARAELEDLIDSRLDEIHAPSLL